MKADMNKCIPENIRSEYLGQGMEHRSNKHLKLQDHARNEARSNH
jgi:hypothetical protein